MYQNPIRNIDPDGRFSWGGFWGNISQGWNASGLSGAFENGLGNIGENVSNFAGGNGFNDNAQLQRSLVFSGKTMPSPGNGSYVEGKISIMNGYNETLQSWKANSGGWNGGAIPQGTFPLGNIRENRIDDTAISGMTLDGNAWSVNIDNVSGGRTLMRIHPDGGGTLGTNGCIGIMASEFPHQALLRVIQINRIQSISVEY